MCARSNDAKAGCWRLKVMASGRAAAVGGDWRGLPLAPCEHLVMTLARIPPSQGAPTQSIIALLLVVDSFLVLVVKEWRLGLYPSGALIPFGQTKTLAHLGRLAMLLDDCFKRIRKLLLVVWVSSACCLQIINSLLRCRFSSFSVFSFVCIFIRYIYYLGRLLVHQWAVENGFDDAVCTSERGLLLGLLAHCALVHGYVLHVQKRRLRTYVG